MNEFSLSDLAAVTGGGRRDDNGLGGDNGILWLLLFILIGGFGNGRGWGNGGGQGAGSVGGNELYPWLNNSQNINDGFRDQMLQTTMQGVQQGINGLSTQLCNCCGDMQQAMSNGFYGVQSSLANGFAGVESSANARQIANMQQGFAAQTAALQGFNDVQGALCNGFNATQNTVNQGFNGTQMALLQGFNNLQAQQAECCCENRLATANQTATILAEHCSDRAALSDGVRDIIASNQANTQAILDKLCSQELDAERRENANLRQQLQMADLRASQVAQTAQILQGQNNEVDALYQRLATCPVGTMPVYGNQPIFTCPQNQYNGCGCGCAA